jgi:hypothetical protein
MWKPCAATYRLAECVCVWLAPSTQPQTALIAMGSNVSRFFFINWAGLLVWPRALWTHPTFSTANFIRNQKLPVLFVGFFPTHTTINKIIQRHISPAPKFVIQLNSKWSKEIRKEKKQPNSMFRIFLERSIMAIMTTNKIFLFFFFFNWQLNQFRWWYFDHFLGGGLIGRQ